MTRVTFVTESYLAETAYCFPREGVTFGAQYDVEHQGHTVHAIFWDHEDEDMVVNRLPIPTLSVPFSKALPTLSEVFGLHIPCVQQPQPDDKDYGPRGPYSDEPYSE